MAWAVRARRRPSAIRSGGLVYRPSRKAAPAAPSGPVTTSRSPGSAPARPGTRSDRPSAVTESDEGVCPGGVAADDWHAGFGDPLVELEQVVDNGVRRSPEGDDEARGLGTRRCEVAEIHGRGAKAEIAKGDPVQPEVHALDECVLRDHEPVDLCRVVLDRLGRARGAPARRGSRARPGQRAALSSAA